MSDTHELALVVINDGASYEARCANARSMTKRQYHQYLLSLITAAAKRGRIQFNQRFKPADIDQAVHDLEEHMQSTLADLDTPVPSNG